MTHYRTKKHNYADDEVISAIQKHIRRGNEKESYYFALELTEESKQGFSLLVSRLKVILYEDIGLADPELVLQVSKAIDDMTDMYNNDKGDYQMVLAHIILLMCRSEKSRITDHFKEAIKALWKDGKALEIPDFALDMHTTRGNKELGRRKHTKEGLDHFIEHGELLTNVSHIKDDYKELAHKIWRSKAK